MALALANDRRRRVVAAVEDGMSCRAAAARFGIPVDGDRVAAAVAADGRRPAAAARLLPCRGATGGRIGSRAMPARSWR